MAGKKPRPKVKVGADVVFDTTPFTVGEWKGRPNYICTRCQFSSLKLATIEAHFEKEHNPPPPNIPPQVQRYNRWGRPIGPPANPGGGNPGGGNPGGGNPNPPGLIHLP